MIKYTLVAALLAASATSAASEITKYECTFAEGRLSLPTPTKIVFSVDAFSSYAKLEVVEISSVVNSRGSAKVVRNNIKVLSIEWLGKGYEFSTAAKEKGAQGASGNYQGIEFSKHRFSVFLKKHNMKAMTRSDTIRHNHSMNGHSSGTCVQL
ncbi:hypothetical protein [Parasedimentitalea maritima]|uniref:Uncharacterized protein n=1 Tax=Parasedimentitalea maritima TaxID=2578117 RepID=A0A6A4REM1_9RHOB|nr:hypothetical protein [Zongyanglinia marina]KAE9631530.1 hypothetical protein GP644_04210 [Zongyanglinia marina]